MKKYKTNKPHPDDTLMVFLRNCEVDPTASNARKLTTKDCVYFFVRYVEPLGYQDEKTKKPYSILQFFSSEHDSHGDLLVEHDEFGGFNYVYNKRKYDFCFIKRSDVAHEHEYPVKLRVKPPVWNR